MRHILFTPTSQPYYHIFFHQLKFEETQVIIDFLNFNQNSALHIQHKESDHSGYFIYKGDRGIIAERSYSKNNHILII